MSEIKTQRLILRPFVKEDVAALFQIMSDVTVNRFLPLFPLKTMEEARQYLQKKYLDRYAAGEVFYYAVCLKTDNVPVGYIKVSEDDSHDLGYGLRREFWNRGIITEACLAVLETVKKAGLVYVTATHDVNNPASGKVMRKAGLKYKYSYEELWQPKNIPVTFRMYQINFDGSDDRIYKKYWDNSSVRFIEKL